MTQRHPHADLIVAWANGAEIQYRTRYNREWGDIPTSSNRGATASPRWETSFEYRIKPTNVVRWLSVMRAPDKSVAVSWGTSRKEYAVTAAGDSGCELKAVLRVEINPDTLELVSATMEAP